jgi:hypothetical protein
MEMCCILGVMNEQPIESDWKKFRGMVIELRERYLTRRNLEIVSIFGDESLTPTERFWEASERLKEVGYIFRTCLHGHSRSKMISFMMLMYGYEMFSNEDMEGFSDEVCERIWGMGERSAR